MKKCSLITSLLFVIILMTSCSEQIHSTVINEHQPYAAKGDGYNIFIGDISDLSFINGESTLLSSLPIYVDKYPFGQGGALFESDQALLDLMTEKLQHFLSILYDEISVPGYEIEQYSSEVSDKVFYNTGTTEIYAGVSGISMITTEYDIIDDILKGNLLENKLIQTALEYMNIESPRIKEITTYNINGELSRYEYTITDTTDDFLQNIFNSSFSNIFVSYAPSTTEVVLIINKYDFSEVYSYEPALPYEEALEYIRTNYETEDVSNINAEVYYSPTVEPGYFIPCYKFYIAESNKPNVQGDAIEYEIVHIPMALPY